MQLSPDGRETLEDALRIYTETAGDAHGRGEREDAVRALEAELREPEPAPKWLEPTIARVHEASEYLASRNAPGLTPAFELLDALHDAAGALCDEIATRRAVAGGELGVGALLTLKPPPSRTTTLEGWQELIETGAELERAERHERDNERDRRRAKEGDDR